MQLKSMMTTVSSSVPWEIWVGDRKWYLKNRIQSEAGRDMLLEDFLSAPLGLNKAGHIYVYIV